MQQFAGTVVVPTLDTPARHVTGQLTYDRDGRILMRHRPVPLSAMPVVGTCGSVFVGRRLGPARADAAPWRSVGIGLPPDNPWFGRVAIRQRSGAGDAVVVALKVRASRSVCAALSSSVSWRRASR